MALILTITDAGRAALVNEDGSTNTVTVAEVGVSATTFTPDASTVSLPDEIKRVTTIRGGSAEPATLHMTVTDDSSDSYSVHSFALYLDDGTLLAAYSQASNILTKTSASIMLLAVDIGFADIDGGTITFGATDFNLSYASTTAAGVVELATTTEAKGKTDNTRPITPLTLWNAFASWAATTATRGVVELATATEARAKADTTRAITPSTLWAAFSSWAATTADAGVVRLASLAEAQGKADAARAITPATLWGAVSSWLAATDTVGVVRLATQAEAEAGLADDCAVTPAGLAAALGDIDLSAVDADKLDGHDSTEFPLLTDWSAALTYRRAPDGFTIAWASGSYEGPGGESTEVINFPITFDAVKHVSVQTQILSGSFHADVAYQLVSWTTSAVTVQRQAMSENDDRQTRAVIRVEGYYTPPA